MANRHKPTRFHSRKQSIRHTPDQDLAAAYADYHSHQQWQARTHANPTPTDVAINGYRQHPEITALLRTLFSDEDIDFHASRKAAGLLSSRGQ